MSNIKEKIDYHYAYIRVAFNQYRDRPASPYVAAFNDMTEASLSAAGVPSLSKNDIEERENRILHDLVVKAMTSSEAEEEISRHLDTLKRSDDGEAASFLFKAGWDIARRGDRRFVELMRNGGLGTSTATTLINVVQDISGVMERFDQGTASKEDIATVFDKHSAMIAQELEKSSGHMAQMEQLATESEHDVLEIVWILEALDRLGEDTEKYQLSEALGFVDGLREGVGKVVHNSFFVRHNVEHFKRVNETQKQDLAQATQSFSDQISHLQL